MPNGGRGGRRGKGGGEQIAQWPPTIPLQENQYWVRQGRLNNILPAQTGTGQNRSQR